MLCQFIQSNLLTLNYFSGSFWAPDLHTQTRKSKLSLMSTVMAYFKGQWGRRPLALLTNATRTTRAPSNRSPPANPRASFYLDNLPACASHQQPAHTFLLMIKASWSLEVFLLPLLYSEAINVLYKRASWLIDSTCQTEQWRYWLIMQNHRWC